MAHCIVPSAEEILDREYRVLDRGFVRLVDYLGGDERIVQAARVSYGQGTKTHREDAALIDYLLRNEHTSPFEQVVLTFHVKLPVFVARQWIRHRTARVNEVSGRYSVMRDEFYLPDVSAVAMQSGDNKQGRSDAPVDTDTAMDVIESLRNGQVAAYGEYMRLLDRGIARELARVHLPLSVYTEWYWQIDLHNLFRFLSLRLDPHAQREIREYASILLAAARAVAPLATASFEAFSLGGVRFSAGEFAELHRRLSGSGGKTALEGRELERFEKKLESGRQS